MKIAIVSALYPTPRHPRIVGGAEVFARQLAETLVARGNEVTVIRNSLDGRRESETVQGVRIEFIPVRNLFPPFQEPRNPALRLTWHVIDDWGSAHPEIDRILADRQPDVLHSNTFNGLTADIWRLARRRQVPVVHTLHDYYLTCPRCARFRDGASCERDCTSCSLLTVGRRRRTQEVDAVVGVSRRTLDLHVGHDLFAEAVPYVVRNAANPAIRFSPRPSPVTPLRIGYLGRFSQEKGVEILVRAVALQVPGSVRLLLAGNVPDDERSRLLALAPAGTVEFVGFAVPDTFYAGVDVVAMPSIWEEPGALALVDALAAGRPVLGTPFGGIPEVIEDRRTGWVVEPTVEAFAARIQALAEEPGQVEEAHTRLAGRVPRTLNDVVDEYEAIYRSVAVPA